MAPQAMAVDVAVVGGGFTGAVCAIHLTRLAERPLDIAVIEPRRRPGRGLAYDTGDPDHRLNAPLPVHFVYPDAPDHLRDWHLRQGSPPRDPARGPGAADPEALGPDGNLYLRRGDFGRYVEAQFRAHAAGNPSGSTLRHLRARAVAARRTAAGYRLLLAAGGDTARALEARLTVLATGYGRPLVPPPFDAALSTHPGFVADPWDSGRIADIPAGARVLVLGMAQTASEAIALLLRNGHGGPILAVARRGLRPRRKPAMAAGPPPDIAQRVLRPVSLFAAAHGRHGTVRGLLRTLRAAVRRAEAGGGDWTEPFGDLRDSVWDLWPALPLAERRRFLRHLRVWYDAHRFQLPPRVEERIARAEAAGQLRFEAARCTAAAAAAADDGGLAVTLRRRADGAVRTRRFDAVLNCTGPDLRPHPSANPLLADLVARGHIAPHPAGPGFDIDGENRAIGAGGRADPRLRIVGPPTYGACADQQGAPFIALRLCRILPGIAAELGRT